MKGDLDLRLVSRLTKIIREEKPDLIHIHSRRGADVFGGIACVLGGRTVYFIAAGRQSRTPVECAS
jgi:hypothetical protein